MKRQLHPIHINNAILKQSDTNSTISVSNNILNIIHDTVKKSGLIPKKDKFKKTLQVNIKPQFEKGLKQGKYIQDKGSVIIRDKKTGRIVSHAKIEEKLQKVTEATTLAHITNLAGQAQLAEISKKLDIINEKITAIGRLQWLEKVSEFTGIKQAIEDALESLPNDRAKDRINQSILGLHPLASLLNSLINDVINEPINFSLINSFKDSFKVWKWNDVISQEYNSKYNEKIKKMLNDYIYFVDMYLQILALISICYQIVDDEHNAAKYLNEIQLETKRLTENLVKHITILLETPQIDEDEDNLIESIILQLKNHRNLPKFILDELNNTKNILDNANELYNRLNKRYDNIELTYDIDLNSIESSE